MEQKRKKGFTLIELLATIVIMSLVFVVGFVLINNIFNDSNNVLDDTTEKMILNAAEQYAIEFRNDEDWIEELDSNGNISFCITLESLINYGYFGANRQKLSDYIDDWSVKMTIENGVSNFKLIPRGDSKDVCKYFENKTSIVGDHNGSVVVTEGDNPIGNLEYDVSKVDDDKYNTAVNFNISLGIEQIEKNAPIYVALIIDNSGSMIGSRFNNAKNAAIDLSESIVENLDSSYVALVQYGDVPYLSREFKNEVLEDKDFYNPIGNTNTSGGIDMVSSLFMDIKDENAVFYTILLYDGEPTHYSKIKYNNSFLYSTSNNVNYFSAFKSSDIFNVYCTDTSTCLSHLKASSNYLKNDINSKLISIGYDFSSSIDSYNLKEISSQDNELCSDSDYSEEVIVFDDLIDGVVGELVQDTSVYSFELEDGVLTSANKGIANSRSHSYLRFDLTDKKHSYTLKINYSLSSASSNDCAIIYRTNSPVLTNTISTLFSCGKNSPPSGGVPTAGRYSYWSHFNANVNNYNVQFTLPAGEVSYLHILYNKYGYSKEGEDTFTIHSLQLKEPDNNKVDISGLMTFNESTTVYPFSVNGTKLISTNTKLGVSQSHSYEIIDLTNYKGTYSLQVNASISSYDGPGKETSTYPNGIIYVSDNSYSPVMLASKSCEDSDYSKCIIGVGQNNDYFFELEGGKKYYVHFIYNNQKGLFSNNDTFSINSLSLYDIGDDVYYSNVPVDGENNILKDLETSGAYGFEPYRGSVVSSNVEVASSVAHSYSVLDLTDFSSEVALIEFKTSISSQLGYDIGNIVITEDESMPALVSRSCFNSDDGICVLSLSGSLDNNISVAALSSGKKYYIHYMYVKDDSINFDNDEFSILSVRIRNAKTIDQSIFPVGNDNPIFNDVVQGVNYNFKEVDGKYISTNSDAINSASYSYVKLDLTSYASSTSFSLNVNRTISTKDGRGVIAVGLEPGIACLFKTGCVKRIMENDVSGNDTKDFSANLIGGYVYYIHLMYRNYGEKTGEYTNTYSINSINLYNYDDSILNLSSLSDDYKYISYHESENHTFKNDSGKLVNTNTGNNIHTFAHGYTKIDLSSYSSSKEYHLSVNASIDSFGSNYGALALTTTVDTPRLYYGYYNESDSSYVPLNLVSFMGNKITGKGTDDYTVTVSGGQVYYLHFTYYNGHDDGAYANTFVINSIKIKEKSQNDYKHYCYYDSDSSEILTLFEDVSNIIIENISITNAKKAVVELTSSKNEKGDSLFFLLDSNGNKISYISKEYDLTKYLNKEKIEITFSNNYNLVINEDVFKTCSSKICETTVKLFDIKITLKYDDNPSNDKVIEVKNTPEITVETEKFITVN